MKNFYSLMVFSIACFGTVVFGHPEHLSKPSADDVVQYFYIDPLIVRKGDPSSTHTIEIATTGVDIARVYLEDYEVIDFFDDGNNGDRISGDGIYTASNSHIVTDFMRLSFGTHDTRGPKYIVEKTDGSSKSYYLSLGLIAEDLNFPAVELAEGLFATQYAFFIEDPEGIVLDTKDWPIGSVSCGKENYEATKKLYSVLPDSFDFAIVMPAHPIFKPSNYAENVPYFVRAKNDIQNIGVDIFDNTSDFGSAGRLKGTIYHSWGSGQVLDHEIGHCWCADIGESLNLCRCAQCYGNHWNPLSDIGGQMSLCISHPDIPGPVKLGNLKNNGDGTWRIERVPEDNEPYSNLDLYAMGLIPSSEVTPVHLLVNPDLTDYLKVTADSVITYTIDDIMADEGGERIPSFQNSPKTFNVAFIVVKNKSFTTEEYAYYSSIAKYFASQEQGSLSLTTFYQATGGRATLNMDLGVVTSVESKTPAISGFMLHHNYPNPFNPETEIPYEVVKNAYVLIEIYNLSGQKIKTLIQEYKYAGFYKTKWNGKDKNNRIVPSGIYLCSYTTKESIKTIKMLKIE